jgi:uncharacterized protein YqjF (DUF2071 family)
MTQTWDAIVWCHWPVPIETMDGRFPPGVRPDVFDGSAWVGLVPFEMRDLRVVAGGRRLPVVPTTGAFSEVNVRTYVVGPNGPGVWFDTLDASSLLGSLAARVTWSLPYVPSRITSATTGRPSAGADPTRAWTVRRSDGTGATVRATVGDVRVDPSPLDLFLTERYALYARAWWAPRRALWAPVGHDPWVLRDCLDVAVDAGVVRAAGYPVPDEPALVTAGEPVQVRIGLPRLV